MTHDRKDFLRLAGTGLFAAGLPAVAISSDVLIDGKDFIAEGDAADEKY